MPNLPEFPVAELELATTALKNGELVAFPTDTFFALGADAMNPVAVEKVFLAKGRNPGTPVPVLISDPAMVENLVTEFPGALRQLADEFWPGALTIVLPASDDVPEVVTAGTGTVGVRVPGHNLARKLIELSNIPLTGTSCNITGQPPTREASVVREQMADKIEICIDAPCGVNTVPSTVVSFVNGRIKVLRSGAITIESLRKIVGNIVED